MSWRKEIRDTSSFRLISGLLVLAMATSILRNNLGVPWNNLMMLGGVGIILSIPLTIKAYLMIFDADREGKAK